MKYQAGHDDAHLNSSTQEVETAGPLSSRPAKAM